MGDERDNVFHVQFGVGAPTGPAVDDARAPGTVVAVAPPDPAGDAYSVQDVARLFGLRPSRLRSWDRSGFIVPSGRAGRRRWYTFRDLVGLRVAKGLMEKGVPFREVRQSVEALRAALPAVERPLAELRVVADGREVTVRDEAGVYEPVTGQAVLDFGLGALRDDVVRMLRGEPRAKGDPGGYELYLEGCRLDENELTLDEAEDAYRRAATLDPSLSSAFTNLGNLRFRRGAVEEAEELYARALEVDPTQPEAHYNLGFLCFERGDLRGSVAHFERALESDPSFADAHFNLAMALEELEDRPRARVHWEAYVRLDPESAWAEIARRHLG